MKLRPSLALLVSGLVGPSWAAPRLNPRDADQFDEGIPIAKDGRGGPIGGGTNRGIDLANPDNLGKQTTDNGFVPNLRWSLSDSWVHLFDAGWAREQLIHDLPASHDFAGAQEHIKKGAVQQLHWHKFTEWGMVYQGRVLVSVVDENGVRQNEILNYGDVWYFPRGVAHTLQGLDDENEYLIVVDDSDAEQAGKIFHVDDWVYHTPRDVLAKNFGVPESTFNNLRTKFPYVFNATSSQKNVSDEAAPKAFGLSSYVYRTLSHPAEKTGGQGGTVHKIDSTTFPIAKSIAATYVTLEPGALRELHWHPNAEEWLYIHRGTARATAFLANSNARTFDFKAGDTAVFPDNAGHYIENTGSEVLIFMEFYKSDRVADVSLTQWLALTPPDIVAQSLQVPMEVVEQLKVKKQVFVPAQN